jgi:transposase
MRYELTDFEWTAIRSLLPNKPRGIPRVDDRRVLNGIFWVLRSGAPWRDLPEAYGPRTTCYNRFVRWRQAGVWDRIMDALAAGHDAAVQMIDTSVVRVHQHGACIAGIERNIWAGREAGSPARFTLSSTPLACLCNSASHPAKLMTTGSARSYWRDCSRNQCCWLIGDMTLTGSGRSSNNRARLIIPSRGRIWRCIPILT